ncbi:MAG TPA: hypothetical protein VHI54_00650 [Actinomycetota bacterium]|nr:hypothetical protein [Actinomycetota bacterium]
MGAEAKGVSDFLDELSTNDQLAADWAAADKDERRTILQQRGYSGGVLQALLRLERDELKRMIRGEKGGNVFVYRYIK